MTERGYFVGRMNPIHLGHEAIIDFMLSEYGPENSTIIVGSSTAPQSLRHFFNLQERCSFIQTLYPEVEILSIPDHATDEAWLFDLDQKIEAKGGRGSVAEARFFGGSQEDVEFFINAGRQVVIMNRFDGTTPPISATEVRDALIEKRPVDDLLNPKIAGAISKLFAIKWQDFKKK